MNLLLTSLIALPLLINAAEHDSVLPLNMTEMDAYVNQAEQNVLQLEELILAVPDTEKSWENTLRPWNRLASDLLENHNLLMYWTTVPFKSDGSFPSNLDAYHAFLKLQNFLSEALVLNPALHQCMLDYAESVMHNASNSYENYLVAGLLGSYSEVNDSLCEEEQLKLNHLQKLSVEAVKTPYLYLAGKAEEKKVCPCKTPPISILNLNTCFLPGAVSYVHGGVKRWEQRVGPLAEKILATNADVICLQEVFTEEGCLAIYEKLKDTYSHFYVAIGPRPLGFSLETLGMPSGLFVASKFRIENPRFTLFGESGMPMNFGFFDFTIHSAQRPLAHIYTTHMLALNFDRFPLIRQKQLQQIIDTMHADAKKEANHPFFLCGDFNAPWGSGEPSEDLIRTYFYDAYNLGRESVLEGERTCTDYFIGHYFKSIGSPQAIDPNFQILDYALLLRKSSHEPIGFNVETTLVPMNSLDYPEQAVTDHHALLTKIQKRT